MQGALPKNIILHAQRKNEQNMVILNAKIADNLALMEFLVDFYYVRSWETYCF